MTSDASTAGLRPVRFGRRSSRGFLFGMSRLRLVTMAVAFAVGTFGLVTSGPTGVVATSPVWRSALLLVYVSAYGRKLIDWSPVLGHWWLRRIRRQHRYRAQPMKPRPAGALAIPGDAARLRVLVDEVTGAAMVHDPYEGTLTAALK